MFIFTNCPNHLLMEVEGRGQEGAWSIMLFGFGSERAGRGRGVERHQGINSNRCVISVAATEHVKLWLMIGTGLIWPSGSTLRGVYAPEVTWEQVAKGVMFGRGRKLSTRFTLWTATPQIKSAVLCFVYLGGLGWRLPRRNWVRSVFCLSKVMPFWVKNSWSFVFAVGVWV